MEYLLKINILILSFLQRENERDFPIVSDRPTSLTVPGCFMTVSELFWP
jgi:hypothetical protein